MRRRRDEEDVNHLCYDPHPHFNGNFMPHLYAAKANLFHAH